MPERRRVERGRTSSERSDARSRARARTRASEGAGEETRRRGPSLPIIIGIAVVLLVAIVALGRFCSAAATIEVTVNGNALSLHGAKTLDTAIRESGWPLNPGDFISIDGRVLKRGEGNPFYATVNGEETLDRDRQLANGDEVRLADGTDIVEDYDVTEETIPCGMQVLGTGALCTFKEGTPKIVEHLTGRVSGAEIDRTKQAEEKATALWHTPDVGDDKVIALTFDNGPSTEYTNQILNVLAENDVKATFFCKGTSAKASPSLVQRERAEGHQVASNTYSCKIDENSGADVVLSEVTQGFEAIDEVLAAGDGSSTDADAEKQDAGWGAFFGIGQEEKKDTEKDAKPVSRIVRFPNALLTVDMAALIADKVDAVAGWNLDTADWMTTDVDTVYGVLMEVEPGEIVIMHDGDYNCSATAEALRRALPELKERGFKFVTIDELLAYPAKTDA